jgi:hypothetical protein
VGGPRDLLFAFCFLLFAFCFLLFAFRPFVAQGALTAFVSGLGTLAPLRVPQPLLSKGWVLRRCHHEARNRGLQRAPVLRVMGWAGRGVCFLLFAFCFLLFAFCFLLFVPL